MSPFPYFKDFLHAEAALWTTGPEVWGHLSSQPTCNSAEEPGDVFTVDSSCNWLPTAALTTVSAGHWARDRGDQRKHQLGALLGSRTMLNVQQEQAPRLIVNPISPLPRVGLHG